jgi:hypothetical protein
MDLLFLVFSMQLRRRSLSFHNCVAATVAFKSRAQNQGNRILGSSQRVAEVQCEFYISSLPGQAVANEKKLCLVPSQSVKCALLSSVAAGA